MRTALVCALAAVFAAVPACVVADVGCYFSFGPPSNIGYNLTSLQLRSPIQTGTYSFSFCQTLMCNGQASVAAVDFLIPGIGDVCITPVGNLSAMSFIPLNSGAQDKGIQITYTGGSCLASGDEGSVIYKVNCSSTSLAPSVEYDWAGCHMTVTIGDPAGCGYSIPAPPVPTKTLPLSGGWVFVIFLIVLSVVYLGGGMAYKRLTLGSSGIESIPNIAFWRAFDANVRLGGSVVVHAVTCRPLPNLMDAEEQYYHGIRGDDYEGMDDAGQPVKMLA